MNEAICFIKELEGWYLLPLLLVVQLLQGCAGHETCPCAYYSRNCCVSISNESGSELELVIVESAKGSSASIQGIRAASDTTVVLQGRGEDNYRIVACTTTGDSIRGVAGYYESGYWIKNRILPDTILTDVQF